MSRSLPLLLAAQVLLGCSGQIVTPTHGTPAQSGLRTYGVTSYEVVKDEATGGDGHILVVLYGHADEQLGQFQLFPKDSTALLSWKNLIVHYTTSSVEVESNGKAEQFDVKSDSTGFRSRYPEVQGLTDAILVESFAYKAAGTVSAQSCLKDGKYCGSPWPGFWICDQCCNGYYYRLGLEACCGQQPWPDVWRYCWGY